MNESLSIAAFFSLISSTKLEKVTLMSNDTNGTFSKLNG